MYNYFEAMKNDIRDYIKSEVNTADYTDREELEESLQNDLFTNDSVTGNGSGSYTFDREEAKEYVLDNVGLCKEALYEFCVDANTIADRFLSEDWEYFDVTIRCSLLNGLVIEVLDDMADELIFNEG